MKQMSKNKKIDRDTLAVGRVKDERTNELMARNACR